jgi:hypothetical protein
MAEKEYVVSEDERLSIIEALEMSNKVIVEMQRRIEELEDQVKILEQGSIW